jgi:hypothetical protein
MNYSNGFVGSAATSLRLPRCDTGIKGLGKSWRRWFHSIFERGVEDLEVGMRLRGDFADQIDFGGRFEVLLDPILGVVRRREDGRKDDEELESLLQNLGGWRVESLFD